jgi:hypothetical protein
LVAWNLILVVGPRVEVDPIATASISASTIFAEKIMVFEMTAALE